jgi:hypothetical protein
MRNTVIVAISAFGLIGCVLFIVAYHLRSAGDWRHNEIGIWLVTSRVNLALIFVLIISGRVFGEFPGREYMVIGFVGLFALQTFWPSKFIWRPTNLGARREESINDSRT